MITNIICILKVSSFCIFFVYRFFLFNCTCLHVMKHIYITITTIHTSMILSITLSMFNPSSQDRIHIHLIHIIDLRFSITFMLITISSFCCRFSLWFMCDIIRIQTIVMNQFPLNLAVFSTINVGRCFSFKTSSHNRRIKNAKIVLNQKDRM